MGSSLSLWASREGNGEEGDLEGDVGWLDITAGEIKGEDACLVDGNAGMEEAVEVCPRPIPLICYAGVRLGCS